MAVIIVVVNVDKLRVTGNKVTTTVSPLQHLSGRHKHNHFGKLHALSAAPEIAVKGIFLPKGPLICDAENQDRMPALAIRTALSNRKPRDKGLIDGSRSSPVANYGTGRRKSALRVSVPPGSGNIVVNDKPVDVFRAKPGACVVAAAGDHRQLARSTSGSTSTRRRVRPGRCGASRITRALVDLTRASNRRSRKPAGDARRAKSSKKSACTKRTLQTPSKR
jgi:small subunit ribosomal protein S9